MWGIISLWACKRNQSLMSYLRTPTLPFAPNSDDVDDPFQMWLHKEKTPVFKYVLITGAKERLLTLNASY